MSRWSRAGSSLKNFIEKVTHEVPTGPHTDITRRKINPSFKKILKKAKPLPTIPKRPKALKVKP